MNSIKLPIIVFVGISLFAQGCTCINPSGANSSESTISNTSISETWACEVTSTEANRDQNEELARQLEERIFAQVAQAKRILTRVGKNSFSVTVHFDSKAPKKQLDAIKAKFLREQFESTQANQ